MLNPEKFQFAQREVDFACFPIMSDRIDILPKYFSTISNLPTSVSTTYLRSWFGLVNRFQLGTAAGSYYIMSNFLVSLSAISMEPRLGFHFRTIKEAIIDDFKKGVEIFDVKLLTCLWTVWLQ